MKLINRLGERYGRLLVTGRTVVGSTGLWVCMCDCGKTTLQPGGALGRGRVKSCGCWNNEKSNKHGMARTKVYIAWQSMLQRCENQKHRSYALYGGRGIKVVAEWHEFTQFYKDMGEPPSKRHSIDRIDCDGDYSKQNCRWATQKEQVGNQRRNIKITYLGKTMTATQWAEELAISRKTIYSRLDNGWSPEAALSTPVQQRSR